MAEILGNFMEKLADRYFFGCNMINSLKPAVYIVGAGPGDPDLLTVKAQRLLAGADLVLFADSLIPQQILDICHPDAQVIGTATKTLEEIVGTIIAAVQSNKSVVRLHSGDVSLYSAIHEQIELLNKSNIFIKIKFCLMKK